MILIVWNIDKSFWTMNQMGNKDSAPVLRDEDVAMLAETSGLGEEVKRNWNEVLLHSFPWLKTPKPQSKLCKVLLLFLFFGQHDKLLVEWRRATVMYRRTSANNSTPSSLNIQTGRWRRKTLGRWWKRFRAIINFDFNTNLSGSAPERRCWQDGETHVQGLRRQRRRLCRLRGVHGEHIFVFAFVIVFVWFMTGMLTLCIWVMGLCAQMIYYIMSDGSPEEVLAKIFRVFDVNRWQKVELVSFSFYKTFSHI